MWRQGKIDHPSEGPWEPAEKIQKVSTEGWIAIEIELPPEVYETIKKQALLDYRDPARQAAYYVNCMVDTSSPHGGDN
jgi:predicted metalloenzyme YecM